MGKLRIGFLSTCVFFASTTSAHADVGVPMIFITLPGMLVALVPITIVETVVLSRRLVLQNRVILKAALMSNAVSTLIGVPIAWAILVALQMGTGGGRAYGIKSLLGKILAVTWQAPWLVPYESDLDWMVPAASVVLLVPFFAASWVIELRVNRRMLPEVDEQALREATRDANLLSYLLLAGVAVGWLSVVLVMHGA
jgi:hypothetical protein